MKMGIQVFQVICRFWNVGFVKSSRMPGARKLKRAAPCTRGATTTKLKRNAADRIDFLRNPQFRGDEKAMPKLKSNRGAAKRLRATGTGKIKHYKAFGSHLLTHKTTKRKRNLRGSEVLNKQDTKNMKRLLPYL